jgi:hypothetical protein
MSKIIECRVNDEYILGSGVPIGAVGSFGDIKLRLAFNEMWDGLTIYATFKDALNQGEYVEAILPSMLAAGELRTYDVPIPRKATEYPGRAKLTLSGYSVYTITESGEKIVKKDSLTNTATAFFRVLESDAAIIDDDSVDATLAAQLLASQTLFQADILERQQYVEDAEKVRVSNEENRVYNEGLRAMSELEREDYENERTAAEGARTTAEEGRVLAEKQRVASEEQRQEYYEDIDGLLLGIEEVQKGYISEKSDAAALVDLKKVYPVGSVYISANETSPAELFGGTWEQLKDRFLLGAGDTYAAAATGGSAEHSHTPDLWADIYIMAESAEHRDKGVLLSKQKDHLDNWVQMDYVLQDNRTLSRQDFSTSTGAGYRRGTNVQGSISTSESLPPYLAVYMWKRIA